MDDAEELILFLMEFMIDTDLDVVSIVGDEELTKELMYEAINNDYDISSVNFNPYEYDLGYITIISWNDDTENYEVDVSEAHCDKFLACGCPTFIQNDFEWKCEYINDVIHNKYVEPDLWLIDVGECDCCEDDEDDDETYSYANKFDDGDVHATVFVESNIESLVDEVKASFEDIFGE